MSSHPLTTAEQDFVLAVAEFGAALAADLPLHESATRARALHAAARALHEAGGATDDELRELVTNGLSAARHLAWIRATQEVTA